MNDGVGTKVSNQTLTKGYIHDEFAHCSHEKVDEFESVKEKQLKSNSETMEPTPSTSRFSLSSENTERLLLFCFIAINAYIGSFIRYGMNYYKIWHTETNYTIMYTQILGSFIMGFILQHRSYMIIHSRSRFYRILYTSISSGLCGTITTFSSWSMVCNNNFYLQWDTSSFQNYIGTYNGGRFFEWITCMMTGVAVPLMALHFGHLIALLTPYNEDQVMIQLELMKVSLHSLTHHNSHYKMNIDDLPRTAVDVNAMQTSSSSSSSLQGVVKVFDKSDGNDMLQDKFITSSESGLEAEDDSKNNNNNNSSNNNNNNNSSSSNSNNNNSSGTSNNNNKSNNNNNNYNSNNTHNAITIHQASSSSGNYFITDESHWLERIMVLVFIVSTTLLIVLPTVVYPTWINITYTAVTGVAGAYLRYALSGYNLLWPNFPLGTFIANISGTWLLALLTVLSKYVVDYYNTDIQSLLMGLSIGFCGCLTTVSTFVSEIDKLPKKSSYIYGITTELTAQLGILIILNLYSFSTIPSSTLGIRNQPHNFCIQSYELCNEFLMNINCSKKYQLNEACENNRDYHTYIGHCNCGNFSTTRNSIKLIDALIQSNTSTILSAWPTQPWVNAAPTEVIDYCISYQNMCNFFMIQIGCPLSQRVISACDRQGVLFAQNTCTCGSLSYADTEIQILLSKYLLNKRYDMIPYTGYITLQNQVDFETAYMDVCTKLLDHYQAPSAHRMVRGCLQSSSPNDLSSWVGECSAGDLDVSLAVGNHIYDALVAPNIGGLSVTYSNASVSKNSSGVWDACTSFRSICIYFLDKIDCPSTIRIIRSCSMNSTTTSTTTSTSSTTSTSVGDGDDFYNYPNGKPENMIGDCICGNMTYASQRTRQLFVDELIAQKIATHYVYLPFSNDPWTISVSSNPFKQLYYPDETVPNV